MSVLVDRKDKQYLVKGERDGNGRTAGFANGNPRKHRLTPIRSN